MMKAEEGLDEEEELQLQQWEDEDVDDGEMEVEEWSEQGGKKRSDGEGWIHREDEGGAGG